MTASPNNRIWFDACIRPNCAMSDRGLALVALGLFAPSLTFGAVMLAARAWPASAFLGGEALLVCAALYFSARRLKQQRERVLLTNDALTVESWDKGILLSRERVEPTWARVQRRMHPDFGCEALFVSVRGKAIRVADALSPPERAELADALEAALRRRKRDFAAAAN